MKHSFNNLFVLSYGALGDFCVLLFFLDHVHRGASHARIVVVTTRNEKLLREMAAAYPFIEIERIVPLAIVKLFLQTLFKKNIFVVPPTFFDMPSFVGYLSRLLTLFRGTVIGFASKARAPKFDITIPFETRDQFYKNFVALLTTLGLPAEGTLSLTFIQDTSVLSTLGKGYIVLAPFASNPSKTLPPGRWVALLEFLHTKYPDKIVAILGGPHDKSAASQMVSQSKNTNARVLCGLPFAQTAAIIAHTPCFIGVDYGLTHVAGVQHVHTVAIENLRTVMWLPRYNPNAKILVEPKNCICDGERGRDCYWVIDGIQYSRCTVDIPQEKIEQAIIDTIETHA